MLNDFISQITRWAVDLMEVLGAPGAGVAIAVENLFPPVPSEVILPLAGFTSAQGTLVLWQVLVWTTAGSVVGALVLYGLGAWLGRERLRRIVDRMPLVSLTDVDRAEAWFDRHGEKAVLLGRMVPIVRSLVSIPAGLERMPVGRFLLLTTAGSAVWNVALVGSGFLLGEQWHVIEGGVGVFQKLVVVAAVVGVVIWVAGSLRRERPRHAR